VTDYNLELKAQLVTIEDLREALIHSVRQGRSTQDPFVLKLSQDLDEELNKYYRMINNPKKASNF